MSDKQLHFVVGATALLTLVITAVGGALLPRLIETTFKAAVLEVKVAAQEERLEGLRARHAADVARLEDKIQVLAGRP